MGRLRQVGLVVAGGMIGSLLRNVAAPSPGDVPWEVFGINLIGALVAGWLVGRTRLHSSRTKWLASFSVVGVAGAFTTFAGLTVDTVLLVDGGRWGAAAAYAGASLLCGPMAAGTGLQLGFR